MNPQNLISAIFSLVWMAAAVQGQAAVLNRWVQLGPEDTVIVRAISDAGDGACPALAIDGVPVAMARRFEPTRPAPGTEGTVADNSFPVLMCETVLPLAGYTARTATVGGVDLMMPVANPKRILVVGDTGCRVLGSQIQACDDPVQFPLAYLSTYAATFKPDLIIHTGDFYYREIACPVGEEGCAGSPSGENWLAWQADWFAPARPLMGAAPLALTRGNHESCDRGAIGWFHLLDVHPFKEAAANCGPKSGFTSYKSVSTKNPDPMPRDPFDTTPSYLVQAGPVALIMFDASYASDTVVQPKLVATYRADLDATLRKLGGKPAFFVAHKPAYGLFRSMSRLGADGEYASVGGGNMTEQGLFGGKVPDAIRLFVSGHTHNFQVVDFDAPGYAPQLVIGNSGTLLDPLQVDTARAGHARYASIAEATADTSGSPRDVLPAHTEAPLTQVVDRSEFGFAVLDQLPDQSGYVADIFSLSAMHIGRCTITLSPRAMTCSPM